MSELPIFKTEEEEAEFWEKNSPLDLIPEPASERVVVKLLKDKTVTLRLDSDSRAKLDELADRYNVGPSTLARLIVLSALKESPSGKT